ncbi:GTP 3',8-cyclase MoaA [Lignipirellula cremea]|uniref:GTP 3',8-cyclase n=1 Tax=Lignipirellula cremea TaxID=2528010 RepID=A0A518DVG8_9BACT|nr:GTP 3',8-cyclase MoaA [Lignipirellula cremea]QDU95830.1 Cyclic pyranopterin monophosphate synthase [Lignipirellula cremea]
MTISPPLVDSLGRVHTNLRISVTDRCNIRCFYCMPDENIRFKPRNEILTFEEITRLATVTAQLGVTKLRLTGGEPLVRSNLSELVGRLAQIPGIRDIALTTNGLLLAEQAPALKAAGLHRLNVSLDGLREATFQKIARRPGLDRVLAGIFAAREAGFDQIRLNAVAISGITDDEILPLGQFAREHDFELRFIEFMPLDAEGGWDSSQVISGDKIRRVLEAEFGPLLAAKRPDPSQPAMDYQFHDGRGRIGFINPVSQPFCSDCNRLRVTAEGQLRNCLFSLTEWDVRALLRGQADDQQIADLVQACVTAKKPGHGIDEAGFVRPERAMYQIGG